MSGGWQIFLFLFILGASAQAVTSLGIWEPTYPDQGYTIAESTLSATAENVQSSDVSIFVIYEWTKTFFAIIFSGIIAVISLAGLFYALGWPVDPVSAILLQLLQLPATLIMFAWMFELVTGRSIG